MTSKAQFAYTVGKISGTQLSTQFSAYGTEFILRRETRGPLHITYGFGFNFFFFFGTWLKLFVRDPKCSPNFYPGLDIKQFSKYSGDL